VLEVAYRHDSVGKVSVLVNARVEGTGHTVGNPVDFASAIFVNVTAELEPR
jgi:hypothetical protein